MANKERRVGTVSRGIRCPIIKEGDDLATIVTNCVTEASRCEGFDLKDRDVVALTESIVARAQGNYASVDDIAKDVKNKFGDNLNIEYVVVNPTAGSHCGPDTIGVAFYAKHK